MIHLAWSRMQSTKIVEKIVADFGAVWGDTYGISIIPSVKGLVFDLCLYIILYS